jgi:hypothetical protein
MNWLKQLFTGQDGQTQDIGRWSWVISLLGVIAVATHEAWTGKLVDLQALGIAIAAVVGAHGAAIAMKKDTEPK